MAWRRSGDKPLSEPMMVSLPTPLCITRSQWDNQHWPHAIFDDGSRVSLYHSGVYACEIHLFLGCNNPLGFQQHDDKRGHAHYICRDWLWTFQQITHEASADGSSFGACLPTYGGGSEGPGSVWSIGLNVLSDIQLLLKIFGPWGQRHGDQFVWSVSPSSWTLRETLLPHDTKTGAVFFWCDSHQ